MIRDIIVELKIRCVPSDVTEEVIKEKLHKILAGEEQPVTISNVVINRMESTAVVEIEKVGNFAGRSMFSSNSQKSNKTMTSESVVEMESNWQNVIDNFDEMSLKDSLLMGLYVGR